MSAFGGKADIALIVSEPKTFEIVWVFYFFKIPAFYPARLRRDAHTTFFQLPKIFGSTP